MGQRLAAAHEGHAAGVPFAAAGWANDIPEIEQFMRKNCDHYCKQVSDLARLLEEA